MTENTTQTITIPLRGDGSALQLVQGVSVLSLLSAQVTSPKPTSDTKMMWVPDPDNELANTIFWVTNAVAWSPAPASGEVIIELTYAPE